MAPIRLIDLEEDEFMPAIGLIDDRKDYRESVKILIEAELQERWTVEELSPLDRLADYLKWIDDFEIGAIILDEKFERRSNSKSKLAQYQGHDLVDFIRSHYPTLPIFIITAYDETPELKNKFKDVEEILSKKEFGVKSKAYVARILRSAQRFLDTFQAELEELSETATKIATGKAKKKDIARAKAIQEKILISFPLELIDSRAKWLQEMEDNLQKLEQLEQKANRIIASVK